jgi:enoyl-CoA hydratase
MTTFNNILTQLVDGMWLITINRESKMNALTIETLQEIKEAVLEGNNDPQVLGIVITGAGSKAFAAGADISEFAHFNVDEATRMSADGHDVMNTIEDGTKLVFSGIRRE